jgi:hypothetical protein
MSSKSILKSEFDIARKEAPGSGDGPKAAARPAGSTRSPLCHVYLGVVVAAGASTLIYSAYQVISGETGLGWVLFAFLTMIASAFSMKLPKSEIRVSVPDAFVFCSILLFGPAAGALTAAVEAVTGSLRAKTKAHRLRFALFNVAAMGFSAYTAGKVYYVLHPATMDGMLEAGMLQQVVFSTLVLAVYYYILNTGLLSLMVGLDRRIGAVGVWMESFSWMAPGYLAAGLIAGLLSLTAEVLNPVSIGLLAVVPLLTYISYRQVIRLMRENRRLKEAASA